MSEGICCPRTHYTCADCFDAHVRNEAGKDLALLAKTDGRILCPRNTAANTAADRCDAAHFADKDIAAQVTHETFELYLDARSKLKEKAVAAEMEAQMNERLERERARAALGAGKEEKLRVAKEHVIETVLTLACPRCKQAFVDFDGCFALKCSRCAAAFCAYCLADCGACVPPNSIPPVPKYPNRRHHPNTDQSLLIYTYRPRRARARRDVPRRPGVDQGCQETERRRRSGAGRHAGDGVRHEGGFRRRAAPPAVQTPGAVL